VGVENVCSDGVVVSVCRHPCIVGGCPCMRVLLEPYEVLVPVWWVFWSPLAWYVVSFFAESLDIDNFSRDPISFQKKKTKV